MFFQTRRRADAVAIGHPLRDRCTRVLRGRRGAINLGPVAGGQDRRLRDQRAQMAAQIGERIPQGIARERDFLAQRQRRGGVVQTECQQMHSVSSVKLSLLLDVSLVFGR